MCTFEPFVVAIWLVSSYEGMHVNSNNMRWIMAGAECGPFPKVNPTNGCKIYCFGTVEAVVKSSMICVWKCYDNLSGFLDYILNRYRIISYQLRRDHCPFVPDENWRLSMCPKVKWANINLRKAGHRLYSEGKFFLANSSNLAPCSGGILNECKEKVSCINKNWIQPNCKALTRTSFLAPQSEGSWCCVNPYLQCAKQKNFSTFQSKDMRYGHRHIWHHNLEWCSQELNQVCLNSYRGRRVS